MIPTYYALNIVGVVPQEHSSPPRQNRLRDPPARCVEPCFAGNVSCRRQGAVDVRRCPPETSRYCPLECRFTGRQSGTVERTMRGRPSSSAVSLAGHRFFWRAPETGTDDRFRPLLVPLFFPDRGPNASGRVGETSLAASFLMLPILNSFTNFFQRSTSLPE